MHTCCFELKTGLMPGGDGRGTPSVLYCAALADESGYCPVHRPVETRPAPASLPLSILDHPDWPLLEPLMRVQIVANDGGRHRLEVMEPRSTRDREVLLRIRIGCAKCKRVIQPVRARKIRRGATMFFNVSCELYVTYGCARSAAAHVEHERVAQYLLKRGAGQYAKHDRDVLPWTDEDKEAFKQR